MRAAGGARVWRRRRVGFAAAEGAGKAQKVAAITALSFRFPAVQKVRKEQQEIIRYTPECAEVNRGVTGGAFLVLSII